MVKLFQNEMENSECLFGTACIILRGKLAPVTFLGLRLPAHVMLEIVTKQCPKSTRNNDRVTAANNFDFFRL